MNLFPTSAFQGGNVRLSSGIGFDQGGALNGDTESKPWQWKYIFAKR